MSFKREFNKLMVFFFLLIIIANMFRADWFRLPFGIFFYAYVNCGWSETTKKKKNATKRFGRNTFNSTTKAEHSSAKNCFKYIRRESTIQTNGLTRLSWKRFLVAPKIIIKMMPFGGKYVNNRAVRLGTRKRKPRD